MTNHNGTLLEVRDALEVLGLAYSLEVSGREDNDGSIEEMAEQALARLDALIEAVPDDLGNAIEASTTLAHSPVLDAATILQATVEDKTHEQ